MKSISIVPLLLLPFLSLANNDIQVIENKVVVGFVPADSSIITGVEYAFPERIENVFIDTALSYATVMTRGLSKSKGLDNNGQIIQFDLLSKSVLWSSRINYILESLIRCDDVFLLSNKNFGNLKTRCIDIKTGVDLWKVRSGIYAVSTKEHIGIGISSTTMFSDKYEGFDLSTGRVIWNRRISNEFNSNWEVTHSMVNDSIMLLIASELQIINIRNGVGWNCSAVTAGKIYSKASSNAVGYVSGVQRGSGAVSTNFQYIRKIVSNCIVDSSSLYFASKEKISKVNLSSGNIEWESALPDDLTSKSFIFYDDSTVYLVNKGYAYKESGQPVYYGMPFFSAFDRSTGHRKYITEEQVKEDYILDVKVANNILYVIFRNRIVGYSVITGKVVSEKLIDEEKFGSLSHAKIGDVFVRNSLHQYDDLTDTTKVAVFTEKGRVLLIDDKMNVCHVYNSSQVGVMKLCLNENRIMDIGGNLAVVDGVGNEIAVLNLSNIVIVEDDKLFCIRENKLVCVDLARFDVN